MADHAGPGEVIPRLGGLRLAGASVDRLVTRRPDAGWVAASWADPVTRVLVVRDGRVPARITEASAELVFVPPGQAPAGDRFLLGAGPDGAVYFAVAESEPPTAAALAPADGWAVPSPASGSPASGSPASGSPASGSPASGSPASGSPASGSPAPGPAAPSPGAGAGGEGTGAAEPIRWAGLREAGLLLADREAALLTQAVALANWHAVAGYCPRCGSVTELAEAGHVRRCVAEGTEIFPRSDPAVIMLVTDPDDRCLLARNVNWPRRRVSVLAGFVEPGESAEMAVVREAHEEAGVTISSVSYASSQPWPMPHSLMLGFRAVAVSADLRPDGTEIAEAAWYTREELAAGIVRGELLIPPSVSISRWLIETWYGRKLPRS